MLEKLYAGQDDELPTSFNNIVPNVYEYSQLLVLPKLIFL